MMILVTAGAFTLADLCGPLPSPLLKRLGRAFGGGRKYPVRGHCASPPRSASPASTASSWRTSGMAACRDRRPSPKPGRSLAVRLSVSVPKRASGKERTDGAGRSATQAGDTSGAISRSNAFGALLWSPSTCASARLTCVLSLFRRRFAICAWRCGVMTSIAECRASSNSLSPSSHCSGMSPQQSWLRCQR